MYEEKMEKIKQIEDLKDHLVKIANAELDKGVQAANSKDLMDIADMIKDCCQSIKDCHEACYYEEITRAMQSGGNFDRMGYDGWRYASGQFAPKGKGKYYGYSGSSNSSGGNRGGSYSGNGNRSGYVDYFMPDFGPGMEEINRRRYYEHGDEDMMQEIDEILNSASPDLKRRIKEKMGNS